MRNEDGGDALGALIGDDMAEPIDVATRQRRSRLVEQQNARLAEDRAGDLDLLLDRQIELADFVVEANLAHAERLEMRRRAGPRLAAANDPERAGRPPRQQHVVEHGQRLDQRHLLEGGLDAARLRVARRQEAHALAEQAKAAAVGLR